MLLNMLENCFMNISDRRKNLPFLVHFQYSNYTLYVPCSS